MPVNLHDDRDFAAFVEEARVHRRIYTDPSVFAAEMRRIFLGTWVYVGHDSEVPRVGDYKSTSIGTTPVILVRGGDGEPRVLVNRCGHRGAAVCQQSRGSTRSFRCSYHGWTFGRDGRLLGVPYSDGYSSGPDERRRGLPGAPRVDAYRGFIFASFNPDVPPLLDYLRDVLPYIDQFVEYAGGYDLQVSPDANEVAFQANWKLQMENNVDGYHLNFVHQSLFAVLRQRTGRQSHYLTTRSAGAATAEAFRFGHAVMDLRQAASGVLRERLDILPGAPPPDADLDAYFGVDDAEKLYLASTGPVFNVSIFPNLNLGSINICEVHPLAVNRTRVVLRPLLLAGAPDGINRLRLRYHEIGSGPAGWVQPDDVEMFERIGDGLAADHVEWLHLDRGLGRERTTAVGRVGHVTDETPQRGQYRYWRQLMGVRS